MKPYVIIHMQASLDGRIDCKMLEDIPDEGCYKETMESFNTKTTITGRNTAEIEVALKGRFESKTKTLYKKEGYKINTKGEGYRVIMDTHGVLRWPDSKNLERPYLIIMSENTTKEYLDYLDSLGISWIVTGKDKIDLANALEILNTKFLQDKVLLTGGAIINTAFLELGLVDELSILIGQGIDGRLGETALFDGRRKDAKTITNIKLIETKSFDDGNVYLRYKVLND